MLNKILLGLALVLGVLALIASVNANARLNNVTPKTGLLGVSAQTTPQHVTGSSVTPYPTIYVWGTTSSTGDVEGLESGGPFWADSTSFFGSTTTFNGPVVGIATSTLSTLTVSGTTTLNGILLAKNATNLFGSAASSTIQVGGASKSGCIILGDSANGASPVYITASGATLTASTTKPAACQTVQ